MLSTSMLLVANLINQCQGGTCQAPLQVFIPVSQVFVPVPQTYVAVPQVYVPVNQVYIRRGIFGRAKR